MMMESTTLSMIHRGGCFNERKEQAEVEPRNCQKTTKAKKRKQQETKKTPTDNKPEKKENKPTKTRKTKSGQDSGKPLFDTMIESSDAESKVGQRLTGAPPWETQRGCKDELTGSDLVEHEKLGRHP
jgi:hypothetical protein